MKISKPINKGYARLLLFFAGWSATPHLFDRMEADEEMDVWIAYDYRTTVFDEDLSCYREVHIIAWSMGVWVANRLMQKGCISPNTAIAVNGTPCPVNDTYGIPPSIFRGTLAGLNTEGMHRFNRRMCGNREVLATYERALPSRPLAEVHEELQAIYDAICAEATGNGQTRPVTASHSGWTGAVVGTADLIFPTSNQLTYWQRRCPVTTIDAPHYPFHLWNKWNEVWKL